MTIAVLESVLVLVLIFVRILVDILVPPRAPRCSYILDSGEYRSTKPMLGSIQRRLRRLHRNCRPRPWNLTFRNRRCGLSSIWSYEQPDESELLKKRNRQRKSGKIRSVYRFRHPACFLTLTSRKWQDRPCPNPAAISLTPTLSFLPITSCPNHVIGYTCHIAFIQPIKYLRDICHRDFIHQN